jgi:hypothetical protein
VYFGFKDFFYLAEVGFESLHDEFVFGIELRYPQGFEEIGGVSPSRYRSSSFSSSKGTTNARDTLGASDVSSNQLQTRTFVKSSFRFNQTQRERAQNASAKYENVVDPAIAFSCGDI